MPHDSRVPTSDGRTDCHFLLPGQRPSKQDRAAEYLAEAAPGSSVVYRSNSLVNQLVAVREGMGIALLPCYLGDPEPGLARAFAPLP